MSFADKYNKGEKKFNFDIPKTHEYHSLKELVEIEGEGVTHIIRAIYINKKSKYGDAPVIATDDCLVNLPQHLNDICVEMINDKETVDCINNGVCGFSIYSYIQTDKHGEHTYYSVNWVDID